MAYRKLYEYAPVAYHEIDHNGTVINVNRAECELLGYEPKEILGKSIWDFVAPEQRSLSKIKVQRKLAGLDPIVPFTRNYTTKEGRILELESRVAAQLSPASELVQEAGMEQERRSLRLAVRDLHWSRESSGAVVLRFRLTRGSFATTVLHEIFDVGGAEGEAEGEG